MKRIVILILSLTLPLALQPNWCNAAELDAKVQQQIDAKLKAVTTWAANPIIVAAVKAQNEHRPDEFSKMTQEQWAAAVPTERFVRQFTQNAAADYLKSQRDATITEAFISDTEGYKVAFLAKPSSWSHKGKPKHDVPLSGKTWQGKVELDESTGFQQIQIAAPVLDAGKPIGSLVVGLSLGKLE